MPIDYVVVAKSAPGAKTSNLRHRTVADALRSARRMMQEGAPAVWIVDTEGNLVLPADQVRMRLRGRPEPMTGAFGG